MLKSGPRAAALMLLVTLTQTGCNVLLQRLPELGFLAALGQSADTREAAPGTGDPPRATMSAPLATALPPPPVAAPVPVAGSTEKDLWQRIRNGFHLEDSDEAMVADHLAWFADHPLHLERVVSRSEPFLHLIVDAVEARDLPTELALLPAVESGFEPFAYSQGQAAGIWQFIPGTGRRFGLRQDWWYDGRRDIVESTRAALDYLEALHERFDDWLLAIAAYNCGEGNVIKAIALNRRRGEPADFWHLDLPNETRAYVPQLLALARVVRNPEPYGLSLAPIENQPVLRQVDTDGPIDLAKAADLAGISIEDLYRLNPAFNRWATAPEGPHRLLLPIGQAERFEQQLAAMPPEERMHWTRHRIQKGETLLGIAARYDTEVKVLKSVNHLQNNRIRTGAHLLVPKAVRNLDEYALSQANRLASAADAEGANLEHPVQAGESLWTIARRYDVTIAQLCMWNGLSRNDTLATGRTLRIRPADAAPDRHSPTTRRITYTVRSGESLWDISQRFQVSIAALRRWNDLPDRQYLQPGQKLLVYVDVTRQSSAG